MATNGSVYITKPATVGAEPLNVTNWGKILTLTCLSISLTVNAVVTSLIVFRIVKVYLEVRSAFEDRDLGVGGGNGKLRSIIFIIIESGMVMFSIQLIRVVFYILRLEATYLIVGINQMFNVIIQPVIFIIYVTEMISRD